MSLKKQFLKSKPVCKVSFRVSAKDANNAQSIQILGDFNNWDKGVEPMKKLKSGDFTQTIELESNMEYQMRYFVNGEEWSNEADADGTQANEFNALNDVISTVQ